MTIEERGGEEEKDRCVGEGRRGIGRGEREEERGGEEKRGEEREGRGGKGREEERALLLSFSSRDGLSILTA